MKSERILNITYYTLHVCPLSSLEEVERFLVPELDAFRAPRTKIGRMLSLRHTLGISHFSITVATIAAVFRIEVILAAAKLLECSFPLKSFRGDGLLSDKCFRKGPTPRHFLRTTGSLDSDIKNVTSLFRKFFETIDKLA